MSKFYNSLGLMSGTSMDGVDASIIQSDGEKKYKVIIDKYFEYPQSIFKDLTKLKDKIESSKDLKKFSKEIKNIEREITLFHAKAVNQILKKTKVNIDFIGFHGQTIYHNANKKISKQLGDGKLLSKLTKKTVIYNFRQNDLKNGGQGAPLTPIFHNLLVLQNKINLPVVIINLGGIANYTFIQEYVVAPQDDDEFNENYITSRDSGPGNCLIDQWIRKNSNELYDKDGKIALSGKINKKIVDRVIDSLVIKDSYDVKDFYLPFYKKLSLEDGAATLAEITACTIIGSIMDFKGTYSKSVNILISGGGRKNNFLINRIKKLINQNRKTYHEERAFMSIKLIDELGIDGDFVESQAFAYLAIRSYLKLPISFPETTGVSKPCTGGVIIKNY